MRTPRRRAGALQLFYWHLDSNQTNPAATPGATSEVVFMTRHSLSVKTTAIAAVDPPPDQDTIRQALRRAAIAERREHLHIAAAERERERQAKQARRRLMAAAWNARQHR